MKTAMESIKGMVDVNTVVGEAVETQDGTVIIPVSSVSLGFVAGGGEYGFGGAGEREGRRNGEAEVPKWPFGGGSGAGVNVHPVGFLIVLKETVRFLPVDRGATLERIIDATPELIERVQSAWNRNGSKRGGGRRDPAGVGSSHQSGHEALDDYDDL